MGVDRATALAGRTVGIGIYGLAGVLGLAVFLRPLWPAVAVRLGLPPSSSGAAAYAAEPGIAFLLVAMSCAVMLLEAGARLGPHAVALLGMLVALNSALRFAENALPGPGEFSPIFAPIILSGFALGARFGFLMGALTLLVSAVVTGGVGPWLPFQMLAAGWVGLTAGWLPRRPGPGGATTHSEIALLSVFGAVWGIGYGVLLTLWEWSWLGLGASAAGNSGGAIGGSMGTGGAGAASQDLVSRFAVYYVTRALAWDVFRAAGNALLILAVGAPVLVALRRVARRFGGSVEAPGARREGPQPGQRPLGSQVIRRSATDGNGSPAPAAAWQVAREESRAGADGPALHPRAWATWLAGIAWAVSTTRNPLVLAELALALAVAGAWVSRGAGGSHATGGAGGSRTLLSIRRFAAVVVPFAAVYNFLFAHTGTTVVARLPAAFPLLGGPLTAESLVYGGATALALVLVFAAFACFQQALGAREIVRLIPRAFGALALVGTVALTYAPATFRQLAAIREAQAVRGGAARGWRDWRSLAVPLFAGGMERAVGLAESLAARGMDLSAPLPLRWRLVVLAGVAGSAGGWLGRETGFLAPAFGAAATVAGMIVLGGALLALGRQAPRTDYRPARWGWTDTVVALAAWLPAASWFASPGARAAMAWSPYPALSWPPIDPWLALALLGPAAMAVPFTRRGAVAAAVGPGAGPHVVPPTPARREDAAEAEDAIRGVPSDIRFEAFGFTYPDAAMPVLHDVQLTLPARTFTLVAGPSGAGKSTLLRAINGLVPHATGGAVRGRVSVGDHDPVALGLGPMSTVVGFVGGDPEQAFVVDVVEDEVAFALEQRAWPRPAMRARVAAALARVGMTAFAGRRIDSLSGGERQRVAIAAALAAAPAVLVLDEPTSQLDDDNAAAVVDALVELAHAGGCTVVVSEHRLDRLLRAADRVVWIPGPGGAIHSGPPAALAPRVALPMASAPAVAAAPAPPLLEWAGVSFSYGPGGPPVTDEVTLAIRPGEIVALTGASGGGKTTLLKLAVGLLRPARGEVRVEGRPTAARPVADICRRVGYLPQDPSTLLFAPTVRDELRATLANHAGSGPRSRADSVGAATSVDAGGIDTLLAKLGILELAGHYPRDLSTGQRQRVALGAVLVPRPAVLLLDEPTRGLDNAAIAALARLLQELAAEGAGIVVATHDHRLAVAAHRRVVIQGGRLRQGYVGH